MEMQSDTTGFDIEACGGQGDRTRRSQRHGIHRPGKANRELEMVIAASLKGERWLGSGNAARRQQCRTEHRPLQQAIDVGKLAAKRSLELGDGKLPHVERIGGRVGRRVDVAIRRADDKNSIGSQYAPYLGDKHLLLVKVLDRLERHDDIDARRLEWNGPRVALGKF